MTQRPADVPSLPLSVTCTPDAEFAETIVALAARVASGEGSHGDQRSPQVQRFTDAVQVAVAKCLERLSAGADRTLSVQLSSDEAHWLGDLRWSSLGAAADDVAGVEAALDGLADTVDCGHEGGDAYCAVRCRRD